MKLTSAAWRLTFAVIILEYIDIMTKEKDNISDFNIKSQQYKLYIDIDFIDKDINTTKIAYILLTKKMVIKNGRLEFITIQSKEIIKTDIKEESLIKTQECIMKVHIHLTIK